MSLRLQADIDRLYFDASKEFGIAVNNPTRGVVWLAFALEIFGPDNPIGYRSPRQPNPETRLEIPVPSGVKEKDIRHLVTSFIRDGYKLVECHV